MSTRKSASLDGSLLARKGDATPAIPEHPLLNRVEAPPRAAAPRLPGGMVPASGTASGGDPPSKARFAPLTSSRRGFAVLVSLALLALVSIAAERLLAPAPAERVAGAPSADSGTPVAAAASADTTAAEAADTTAAEAAVLGAPPDLAAMPALPPLDAADASAAVEAPPEPAAEPAPESAPPRLEAVTAAVVPDAPLPPIAPARKAVGRKSAALTPPPAAGPYVLQLAAFSSAAPARGEAVRLQKRLDAVLGDREVVVVQAGSDRRPVYRLRASGYPTLAAARAACERIRKLNSGCLALRR